MFKESHYPVVIVGAGPVGLVAAHYLESMKIRTLLVEKNERVYTYPRAIGIDDEALRILKNLCFSDDDICSLINQPNVQYFSPSGEYRNFIPCDKFKPFGYPILSTFFQPQLENLLHDRLSNSEYVEFISGCYLTQYKNSIEGYSLDFLTGGQQLSLTTSYLLGCDGGKSTVRELANIDFKETDKSENWLVVDVHDSSQLRDNIIQIAKSQTCKFPCVTINFPKNMRRFEVKLDEEVFGQTQEMAKAILSHFFQDLDINIIRARVYRRSFCLSNMFSSGNVFLLGDAAHLVPPYGGQGMCSGIRDANNLCWKLAAVINENVNPRILNSYHVERYASTLETMQFIRAMSENIKISTSKEKDLVQSIDVVGYRKMKPYSKYESSLCLESSLSGYLFPFIKGELLLKKNETIDFLTSGSWSLLVLKSYANNFKKNVMETQITIKFVELEYNILVNCRSIQEAYELNILELFQQGYSFILRPDLHIFSIASSEDLPSVLAKLQRILTYD